MIHPAHHQGWGVLNQSFPIWDHAAWVYWDPSLGDEAITRGGAFVGFTYTYSGTSNYTYWDPGRGIFTEIDPTPGPAIIPRDGHFPDSRQNNYISSDPNTSFRSMSFQSGLSIALVGSGPLPDHIIERTSGPPSSVPAVTNITGATRRMYNSADEGAASQETMWSILIKRVDGGIIDSSVLTLGASDIADPLGANLSSATTQYRKIRSDGWYLCYLRVPGSGLGTADIYYWVEWATGVSAYYEAPQVCRIQPDPAGDGDFPIPSPPIITETSDTVGRTRASHQLNLDGDYDLPSAGWFGVTLLCRDDYDQVNTDVPGLGLATVFEWRIDSNNRIRLLISESADNLRFFIEESGATQVTLDVDRAADMTPGNVLGLVGTWGYRNGSVYAMLCLNGSITETETTNPETLLVIPSGGPGVFSIGTNSGGTSAPAGGLMIQSFALGYRALSRHDCRSLSTWFQRRATPTIGNSAI